MLNVSMYEDYRWSTHERGVRGEGKEVFFVITPH